MKRHFSKIVGLSLGIALAIGVGAGIATNNRNFTRVDAAGNITITSAEVVTNSGYAKYETSDWIITFGGNNKSVGTNSGNRSNCNLSSYSKYAVSPVTTSSVASAFVSLKSLSNINGISYTFSGGSNQTSTKVYAIYSSDDTTFAALSVTGAAQGHTIASDSKFNFSACNGYFGLLLEATNASGNWRIDDFNITFYDASGAPSTYTVTYNSNGGSGTMTDTNSPYTAGATVTVMENTFTRANYAFDHWDTKADDSGTDYAEGATFTINGNVTLYAQWVATRTVTYNSNGGSGTMTDTNSPYITGSTVTVMDNTFTRDDYVFDHWNTKADDSGTDYAEGATFTISANTTLFAQWRLADLAGKTGIINFGNASGSLKVNADSVSGKDDLGISWTVTTTGTTSYTQSDTYSQIGSSSKPATSIVFEASLYDTYKVTSFSVTLGGFTSTAGNVTLKVGDTTVGSGTLNATSDVEVSNSSTVKGSALSVSISDIAKGVKAYSISYTLESPLEDQTITSSTDSANVGNSETITLTTNAASADWSIVSDTADASLSLASGKSTVVSANQEGSVTVQAVASGYKTVTKTVYFVSGTSYDVTFNSNGGSESPAKVIVSEGGTFVFPSAGTKTGYVFDGWTSTGSAPYHAVGATSPEVTDDITYTAHWTEIYEHTVYFGTADGTAGLSNFANTSYIIPSEVTLDNIQGNIYGKNDNTAAAIRLGKGDATGSFDVTIDSDYYIKKVIANLKYYSSDSTAEFAVSPNAEYSVKKAGLTNSFADYEFDVSEAFSNKVTFGNTITGKRVCISGFTIEYDIKPSSVAAIKAIDTASALKFNYTDSITNIESFTNTAIRFGGFMSKALWDSLAADVDIEGYGILVAAKSGLGEETIKQKYASAKTILNTPEQAITSICSTYSIGKKIVKDKANPTTANDDQKLFMDVTGDYYVWTVKMAIGDDFTAKYNAVAFILIDGGIVFLDEVSYSAKDIATRDVPNTDAADPALPALTWIKDH